MSRCVIVAKGFGSGATCPHDNQYLESFNHDTHDGIGYGEFTSDKSMALIFDNPGEALEFWKRQSKTVPLRGDGKPNRPMTCLNIGIEHI